MRSTRNRLVAGLTASALSLAGAPAAFASCTTPTFTQAAGSPVTAGRYPVTLAVADFNGDKRDDVAIVNLLTHDVSILLGSPSGPVEAPGSPLVTGGVNNRSIAAGDFDGDGKLDLATANFGSHSISVYLG